MYLGSCACILLPGLASANRLTPPPSSTLPHPPPLPPPPYLERMRQEVTRLEREACDLIHLLETDEAKGAGGVATSTAVTAPSSPAAADTQVAEQNSPLTPHALEGLVELATASPGVETSTAVSAVDMGRFQEGKQVRVEA